MIQFTPLMLAMIILVVACSASFVAYQVGVLAGSISEKTKVLKYSGTMKLVEEMVNEIYPLEIIKVNNK